MPTDVATVAIDHARLGGLLDALDRAVEASPVGRMLDELREFLMVHFRAEERPGGFFESVQERTPWESAVLDALRLEHTAFIVEIDRIRGRLDDTAGVLTDIRHLVVALRDHERREGTLLHAALASDIGHGD